MSIREDVELYTKLSGEDGSQETIATIGAYLRGYGQGKEDAEPHWIPCSDGLPKTNDPVNVTYVNHNPGNYYAEVKDKSYTATAHFHNGQWYWYSCTTQDLLNEYGTWIPDLIDKDVEITAWMPLPESYRGE